MEKMFLLLSSEFESFHDWSLLCCALWCTQWRCFIKKYFSINLWGIWDSIDVLLSASVFTWKLFPGNQKFESLIKFTFFCKIFFKNFNMLLCILYKLEHFNSSITSNMLLRILLSEYWEDLNLNIFDL